MRVQEGFRDLSIFHDKFTDLGQSAGVERLAVLDVVVICEQPWVGPRCNAHMINWFEKYAI